MCTLYTNTNAEIESIWIPQALPAEVPRLNPWDTSSTTCAVCVTVTVCVRVYTHIHTPTLPPVSKIEKIQDNTSTSPSVRNNPSRQATCALD